MTPKQKRYLTYLAATGPRHFDDLTARLQQDCAKRGWITVTPAKHSAIGWAKITPHGIEALQAESGPLPSAQCF